VLRWVVRAIAGFFRSRAALVAENLCLRQQLLVLQRRRPRPRLTDAERRFWILASRWFRDWQGTLLIVKPETVLGWHRKGWKAYWRWRSRVSAHSGRPPVRDELRLLIRRMTSENVFHPGRRRETSSCRYRYRSRRSYSFGSQSWCAPFIWRLLPAYVPTGARSTAGPSH
jgi:hypothetical protein